DLTILPNGKLQISVNEEEAVIYDYMENEIIRRIPDFSFSREVDAGSKLVSEQCSFTILLNEQFNPESQNNFRFRFHSKDALVKKYKANLEVTRNDKETSILNLKLRD